MRWCGAELRLLGGTVRAPRLWVALGAALLLWSLAYQSNPPFRLDIGGDRAARLRGFDSPFLTGFNDPEPANRPDLPWHAAVASPYRWAGDRATVTFPGAGGDRWVMRVTAASGRPDGSAIDSLWQVGDAPPFAVRIAAQPRVYAILGQVDALGDLRLTADTSPLISAVDPRTLGMVLFRVVAAPAGSAPVQPAWAVLALLALALGGLYALIRRAFPPGAPGERAAFMAALAVALLAAWMLAIRRMDLTILAPGAAILIWAGYLLTVLVAIPLRTAGYADAAAAAGLTAGAFMTRMAGMLHPYALTSDLGLHVNNLGAVARGALFFTEGLPCRAGAGPQPYPPGGYLALLPGILFSGVDRAAQTLLVRGGTALLESLTTALLWWVLRRAGMGRNAALIGAALYMLAPPLLRSYSVGEMANLLAQALVAPLMLWLALAGRDAPRWLAPAGAALLAIVLLSHGGIALSAGAMLAVWAPLRLVMDGGMRDSWRRLGSDLPWRQIIAVGVAGIAALALFYSAFGYIAEARRLAQAELAAQGVICPPGDPLFSKLNWWVAGLVFGAGAPVPPFILAAGAIGALLIARRRNRPFGALLAACWLGTILSLGTLIISDQPVRWTLFIYPALSIGAGASLAFWGRRGRAGLVCALAIIAFLLWYGAADWVRQVSEYLR